MEEKLIEFETAVLAKKVGFDEPCRNQYYECGKLTGFTGYDFMRKHNKNSNIHKISHEDNEGNNFGNYKSCCAAPTQTSLHKWLREKYGIYVLVIPTVTANWTYKTINIVSERDNDVIKGLKSVSEVTPYTNVCGEDFTTYENALEDGLYESLKLVKFDTLPPLK